MDFPTISARVGFKHFEYFNRTKKSYLRRVATLWIQGQLGKSSLFGKKIQESFNLLQVQIVQ